MKEIMRLLSLYRPWLGWVLLGIALSLLTLISNIGLMAVSGWFIAAMAVAGVTGTPINYFTPAAMIRMFAILRTGGRYAERLVTHEATFRLLSHLRVWFYQHLEPLAPARLQQYRSGDLLSRIRADIDTLNQFYLRIVVPVVVAFLVTLIGFTVMAQYSLKAALVMLALLLLAGVLLPWWMKSLGEASGREIVRQRTELRSTVVDGVQGMAELMVYGAASDFSDRLRTAGEELAAQQKIQAGLNGISMAGLGLAAGIALWGVVVAVIPEVRAGTLTPPQLPMLALFAMAAFESVQPLPLAFQTLGETIAAARRLFEIVDTEPAVRDPQGDMPQHEGYALEFESVEFAYADESRPVFSGFNLKLDEGERLVLMGPTGCGKSTVVNLLLRFQDPRRGAVRLGGVNLRQWRGEEIRRQIAVVPQRPHLFTGTIRENLLLAKPDATEEELLAACEVACIAEFVGSLAEGLDTWVGETGAKLSGGQLRRIAIARAVLRDARILVLDEPTEGLDPHLERQVMRNVLGWLDGRSLLLITHKLGLLDGSARLLPFSECMQAVKSD